MSRIQRPASEPDSEIAISALESVLLVAGGPVPKSALAAALELPEAQIDDLLRRASLRLSGGIRLQIHDGQAQLVTAPEHVEVIHRYLGTARPPALSRSALEALAVIAYHQPATRAEVEAARGVNSDRAIQTLLARGLIEERGRRESPGRPLEYGTAFAFLEYFGLSSIEELPPLGEQHEAVMEPAQIGLSVNSGL